MLTALASVLKKDPVRGPTGILRIVPSQPPEPPLALLVRAAQDGDRSAYGTLYARMRGAVHAVILARVPARNAQDVLQDVFVNAWVKLPELREPAAFPGWVLEMARRTAMAAARRDRMSERGEAPDEPILPIPSSEAREALTAILGLPETYRETLLMRLVHGMSGPEIAEATGLAPESVRVNLCRGMKLLRGELDGGDA